MATKKTTTLKSAAKKAADAKIKLRKDALALHEKNQGKIEIASKVPLKNKRDLSLAYSPGVAEPCIEIAKNKEDVYKYTAKGNMVAVITDGTAVLGLGDIGPEAALPVMEGKSILLKGFANVDSFPICLDTKDPQEIIAICKALAPGLGGINLEDIRAPKCVEIERTLIDALDIPVFHDDQHGTAIVTSAALINACKLTGKKIEDVTVSLSGTGAAGSSIARMLKKLGVKHIYAYNSKGAVHKDKYNDYDFLVKELLDQGIISSKDYKDYSIAEVIKGTDVFVGVSAAGIVTPAMIKTMNKNPFVFAMANPTPEIMPDLAKKAGALVVGTGRSDFPNQVNNVLAFPGIFRGALDCHSRKINEEMKMAAAKAIASLVSKSELSADFVIPSPFDPRVAKTVAKAVMKAARETGVARK